jgi:predicted neutral ceramidase superfamily lipid hydrolase
MDLLAGITNCQNTVDRRPIDNLLAAIRPSDDKLLDHSRTSKSKVETRIVGAEIAAIGMDETDQR